MQKIQHRWLDLQAQNQIYKDIIYVFVQHYYFHPTKEGLTVQQFADLFKKSEQHIRNILKELLQHGFVQAKGVTPVLYELNENFF